jgi:hypothetical protein
MKKKRALAILAAIGVGFAAFVASPLDDLIIAALVARHVSKTAKNGPVPDVV